MDTYESAEVLFDKVKEKIRKDTIDEINIHSIDVRVRSQHTRLYKFWCWLVYGHLIEKNTCLRCGKSFIQIKSK